MKNQYSHLLVTFAICIFTCFAFSNFSSAQSRKEIKEFKKKIFNVKLRNKQVFEKIHFKLHQDMVIIPVTINGKTYNFIFDAGAMTIFSDSLAKNLTLTTSISLPITDANKIEQTMDFYCTDSVQVGSLYFDNVGYGVINLDNFEKVLCMRIDGLLGTNIFRLLNWEIDFSNQIISVSNKPFSVNNYAMKILFKESFGNRSPKIRIIMSKYGFYATFDRGYNEGIKISDNLFFKSGKSSYLKSAKGIGEVSETLFNDDTLKNKYEYISEIDLLYIGKNRHNSIVNEMVGIEPYPSSNLIGNSFLKKYGKITINWKQKKIFLGEKDESNNIDDDKTFGYVPDVQDNKLIVSFIWENADAYKKGIRIGDQIMSINGISTEKIDDSQWCEISAEIENLDSDNRTIELLNSAGEKVIVNIKQVTYKSLLED
jgi:hypothetical protein